VCSTPVYISPKISLTQKILIKQYDSESSCAATQPGMPQKVAKTHQGEDNEGAHDKRPVSASMSYIPRNKHLRNASQRPESASHVRLSSRSGSIHIQRRMIWNEEIYGMVVEVLARNERYDANGRDLWRDVGGEPNCEICMVRVYVKGEKLLTERPLQPWPRTHLKPISRTQFAARTKIPFIQQKWIPKEIRDMFMMSKREKRRLELSLATASVKPSHRKRPATAGAIPRSHTAMSHSTQDAGNVSSLSSILNNSYHAPESYKRQMRQLRSANSSSVSLRRRSSSAQSHPSAHPATDTPSSKRIFPSLPLSSIHMPIHTTTTEDDIQYLSEIILQRKRDMEKGKLGTSFMHPELVEDKRIKRINRNSSTSLTIANEVPTLRLTRLHESIRKEQRTGVPLQKKDSEVSNGADDSPRAVSSHTPRRHVPITKNGSSRFDRLLHSTRHLSMTQLQSDFDARKIAVRKELERDGVVVFGKSTNFEHFFKAKLVDVLCAESKSSIILKIKTKGLVHDCVLDGVETQPNMAADIRAVIWKLVEERRKLIEAQNLRGEEDPSSRHDLIYFPVRSNTEGQLCVDVFVQLQWMQCVLLHYGLAKICKNRQSKLGIERLVEHQTMAKQKKIGLWQYHITKRHSSHVEGEGVGNQGRQRAGSTGGSSTITSRRHSQMPRTIRRVSLSEVSILDTI